MASIAVQYANKASGVYRDIIDATQSARTTSSMNVVVLIQSEQGQIMRPIYIQDKTELHAMFGKRDHRLEQKGCYGILIAEHVLQRGPIWVMNIKNVDPYNETLESVALSTNPMVASLPEFAQDKYELPVAQVYDTNKFWQIPVNYGTYGDKAALSITSVLGETISVIIRKHQTSDYNYTVAKTKEYHEDFHGVGLDDNALVSDYLVEISVFKSNLLNAKLNVIGAISGGKVDVSKLDAIKLDSASKYFATYTGSIGDVIDINGNNLSVIAAINADYLAHGCYAAVNLDAIIDNNIELSGISALQFNVAGTADPTLASNIYVLGQHVDNANLEVLSVLRNNATGYQNSALIATDNTGLSVGQLVADRLKTLRVLNIEYLGLHYELGQDQEPGTIDAPVQSNGQPFPKNLAGEPVYPSGSPLAGQLLQVDSETGLILDAILQGDGSIDMVPITLPENYDAEALAELYGEGTPYTQITFDSEIGGVSTGSETIVNLFGTEYTLQPFNITVLKDIWSDAQWLPVHTLHGLVSLEKHYVNGTAARQNAILDVLNTAGVTNSFIDPTIFRCRYMVDTFKTYIESNTKSQLAKLANDAKRFLVFTPGPFYHELLKSKNPDFHDLLGRFDMSYVKQGKNPNKPSTNSFSFPQDIESAKYLVPVMNVIYNDGFSSKVIPATGALANLFYSKHTGTRKVYDIVAGQDWPLSVTGLAPEFEPDIDQRAQMEQIGINVIQNINGVLQLRSNKTAMQAVNSAFNYPETLEKVFYISDAVEPVLDGKLFKHNNEDTRLAVKTKADDYADIMVSDGVITSYVNTCDLSNNDEETRKAGIIVLDTELFNEFGIRIALHRTTVATEAALNNA